MVESRRETYITFLKRYLCYQFSCMLVRLTVSQARFASLLKFFLMHFLYYSLILFYVKLIPMQKTVCILFHCFE